MLHHLKKFNRQDVDNSIDICGLRNFVEKLPKGLHTNIGEAGAFLSGGENKEFLLLDQLLISQN